MRYLIAYYKYNDGNRAFLGASVANESSDAGLGYIAVGRAEAANLPRGHRTRMLALEEGDSSFQDLDTTVKVFDGLEARVDKAFVERLYKVYNL